MRKNLDVDVKEKEPKTDLSLLIDLYGKNKDTENSIKKVTTKQNLELKELLKKYGKVDLENDKYVSSGKEYTATLSVEDNSSINEEKLLEFLKKNLSKSKLKSLGIIKTREYVDEAALENAIYKNEISPEMVTEKDSCKDPGTKEVLRIAKKKGE